MSGFKMDDYVDVAERIRVFYERFPDGRLVTGTAPEVVVVDGRPFIWYHARAYRTPDDPLPGDGWAAEPVPGPTQFTRDSELMNAETAAWGRAIVALGFATKKIASSQEVQARTTPTPKRAPARKQPAIPQDHPNADPKPEPAEYVTPGHTVFTFGKHEGKTIADVAAEGNEGRRYIHWAADKALDKGIKAAAAAFLADDDIPF